MWEAETIASQVLASIRRRRQVLPFTSQSDGFRPDDAYAVTAELRRLRIGAGARPAGRKIGFTNPVLWDQYGVRAPIWGDMYDETVRDAGDPLVAAGYLEPRLEPEIVFGLDSAIAPDADLAAIEQAIGWVAHGFEIVQSIYPGWQFGAADAIAGGGLHAALIVGPRLELAPAQRAGLAARLSALSVVLLRDGEEMDRGTGAAVLGGPAQSLAHLVKVLSGDKANPPLAAGETVTTGTMTKAFPVAAGERWETRIDGFDLPGLVLDIA